MKIKSYFKAKNAFSAKQYKQVTVGGWPATSPQKQKFFSVLISFNLVHCFLLYSTDAYTSQHPSMKTS